MKLNCGLSYQEKCERKKKWHKWFAWHPVRVGSTECRWLETVMRKGERKPSCDPVWEWEYKTL